MILFLISFNLSAFQFLSLFMNIEYIYTYTITIKNMMRGVWKLLKREYNPALLYNGLTALAVESSQVVIPIANAANNDIAGNKLLEF